MRAFVLAIAFVASFGLGAAAPASAQSTEQHFAVIDALLALVGDMPGGISVREAERQMCQELPAESARACSFESGRRNDMYDRALSAIKSARSAPSLKEQGNMLSEPAWSLAYIRQDLHRWLETYFPEQLEKLGGRKT